MLSDYFKDRFDGFNLFHGKSFMFSEVKPADVTTDYQTIKGYKALIDSATGQPIVLSGIHTSPLIIVLLLRICFN